MSVKLLKSRIKNSILLQQDESDCGVASLCSIIKYYGGYVPLEEIRAMSGTTTSGTTMLGLIQAGEAIGLISEGYRSDIEALKKIDQPCILHTLKNDTLEHFIVCYGFYKERFVIGDPSTGYQLLTEKQLIEKWQSQALIMFRLDKSFSLKENKISAKYLWLKKNILRDKNLVLSTIMIGTVIAILNLASAIFIEKLVDNLIPSKVVLNILLGLGGWFSILMMRTLLVFLRESILIRLSFQLNKRLVGDFIHTIFHLPKRFFDSRKKGDLITRLYDTQKIQGSVGEVIGQDVIEILMLISSIVFTLFYSRSITIVLILIIPMYFIIIKNFYSRIYNKNKTVLSSYADNESRYIDSLSGISTIKQLNQQKNISNELNDDFSKFQSHQVEASKIEVEFKTINELFGILSIFLILAYCITEVLTKTMQIGDMLAIFSISTMALGSTGKLALSTIHLQESKAALDRAYDIIAIPNERTTGTTIEELDSIKFIEVDFSFPGRSLILNKISFELRKKSIVSIQGENGSGKSTIMQLLQLFYVPISGQVLINGLDVSSINPVDLRGKIGVVPQGVKIFNNTLQYNVTLNKISDQEFLKFCDEFGFSEFFDKFPMGYETVLGEEGVKASGGQVQMIGLARALFYKPQFLMLDEFTSNMDNHATDFTYRLIDKLSSKMGILIISHDPKIINLCNFSYVIKNGTLAALL